MPVRRRCWARCFFSSPRTLRTHPLQWANNRLRDPECLAQASRVPAGAGPGGPRRGGMGRPGFGFRTPTFPLLEALDAGKDGKLSPAEVESAVEALKKLDKNADGKLSKEEVGWPPARVGPGGPGTEFGGRGFGPGGNFVERIMSNDRDGDGEVTEKELPEQMQWMVKRMDTNQDGAIDRSEAEAAGAQGSSRRSRRKRTKYCACGVAPPLIR